MTTNGTAVNDKWANPSGANPYGNTDGGEAIRLLNPCEDGTCTWQEGTDALTMTASVVVIAHRSRRTAYLATWLMNRASAGIPLSKPSETVPISFSAEM